jgi:Na+/melibiose symporter-like transporter
VVLGSSGGLVAMTLTLVLLTEEATTELNPLFKPVMILVGILAGLILFLSSYAITENEYARTEETLGFRESMLATLRNREFLAFESMNFFREMGFTVIISSMIYFVQYVMNLQGSLASIPLFGVFVMMLSFSFLADRMVRKRGLKQVYLVGMIVTSVGLVFLLFSGIFFIGAIASLLLIGVGLAPVLMIWSPLLADVMDYDEILTGKRRETTHAGMNALITKPADSLANASFLIIISAFGFDNTLSMQPDSAILGVQIGYALFPALLFLIGAVMFWKWYQLDGMEWIAKKVELGKIHLKKEREYIDHLQKEGKISNVYQKLYKNPSGDT